MTIQHRPEVLAPAGDMERLIAAVKYGADAVYLAGTDGRSGKVWVMRLTLGGYRERSIIRTRAALYALDMLRRMALGVDVPDAVLTTPDCLDQPEALDF